MHHRQFVCRVYPHRSCASVMEVRMTAVQAVLRARPQSSAAARLFVDYNPFYVLSAICMLFGVFALNNSFTWSPIPTHNLLTVIFMINVYEAMLIGLAALLLRRNIRRDAALL